VEEARRKNGVGPGEGTAEHPADERSYLASKPPELRVEGVLDEVRARISESGRRVVVLDDGPTGVQSVYGVPILALTTWVVEDLRWRSRNKAQRSTS